ncbi:MAG: GDP-mannose 4,6-dehydratase [Candidatus Muiribacteriota bacterium]
MKKALITGVTGQDGAYLAEFLLKKGYEVYGTVRRTSSVNLWRLYELDLFNYKNFKTVQFDLIDQADAIRTVKEIQPDEIYNLAAMSFVGVSFKQPTATAQMNGMGALYLLEAVRILNPDIKFYQASTSELFGKVQETPQNEKTPFYPRSPYGVSKLFAHWSTINYRESYNIFASCGILFNHESPLRGIEFVTRKITDGVAKIKLDKQSFIELGNLSARRDWGFAREYVEGMYRMLQKDKPHTYVLSTGKTYSIRDFCELAFKAVDIEIKWQGEGVEEVGVNKKNGKIIVKVNPIFFRPTEVDLLIGDAQKAYEELDWKAETDLPELTRMMVSRDLERLGNFL